MQMVCPLHKNLVAGKGGPTCSRPMQHLFSSCSRRTRGNACVAFGTSRSSTTLAVKSLEPTGAADDTGTIRVKLTPPREISQPPSPPSLIHSPVYVQKALIKPSTDALSASSASTSAARLALADDEQEGNSGNSFIRALKQVDRSLDELEQNPLPLQRELYELSRSPVGDATSSALTTAAKVTVAAGREAVRAAVPLGQWVVKEGARAAFALMSRAVAEGAKMQQQQKAGGGSGSGSSKKRK